MTLNKMEKLISDLTRTHELLLLSRTGTAANLSKNDWADVLSRLKFAHSAGYGVLDLDHFGIDDLFPKEDKS